MSSSHRQLLGLTLVVTLLAALYFLIPRRDAAPLRQDERASSDDPPGNAGATDDDTPNERALKRSNGRSEPDQAGATGHREPLPTATSIAGRVVDSDTRPVTGAVLRVLGVDAPTASTDASGEFRLIGVPHGVHDVRAGAAGLATTTVTAVPSGTDDIVIRLRRESTIAGRALFVDGTPVPGAEVLAFSGLARNADPFSRSRALDGSIPPVTTCTTDQEGRFDLHGLARGDYFLQVRGPGVRRDARFELVDSGPDSPDAELIVEQGSVLEGVVVDASEAPVAGAELLIRRTARAGLLEARTRTDPNGRFRLDTLGPPTWEIRVRPDGGRIGTTLLAVDGDRAPLRIELPGGRRLDGRVVDGRSGIALAGVEISTIIDDSEQPRSSCHADTSGDFSVEIPPGDDLAVRFRAAGFVTFVLRDVEPSPDDDTGDGKRRVVEMQPSGRLPGVVVDSSGAPVSRARVDLVERDTRRSPPRSRTITTTTSDNEGRFACELAEIRAGPSYSIRVRHPDFPTAPLIDMEPSPTDPRVDLEAITVKLERGGTVAGTIRDADGSLAGVTVQLAVGGRGVHHSAESDSRGIFRILGVGPGEYSLRVDAMGYAPVLTSRFLVHASTETEQDIVLEPERVIAGLVVTSDGRPLPAAVEAIDRRYGQFQRGRRAALCDQTGRFRLGSLHHGAYNIRIISKGHATQLLENITAPAELEIRLESLGAISGRIVHRDTRDPVTRFRISLLPSRPERRLRDAIRPTRFEDTDGQFTVEEVPRGDYRMSIDANGFLPRTIEVPVPGGSRATDLSIELDPGRWIKVLVRDESGTPVAAARLAARRVHGQRRPGLDRKLLQNGFVTDESGRARISGLTPGRWVIDVEHDGLLPSRSSVMTIPKTSDARRPEAVMTLRRGVTLQGLVSDADGVPLTDGAVLLLDGRETRTTKISRDGSYTFPAVAAGIHHLRVRRHLGTLGNAVRVRVEEGPVEQRRDLVTPR